MKHEAFLNKHIGRLVEIYMMDGSSFFMVLEHCDNFALIGTRPGEGSRAVVFKHAIKSIIVPDEENKGTGNANTTEISLD